jgi:hypothetical protein
MNMCAPQAGELVTGGLSTALIVLGVTMDILDVASIALGIAFLLMAAGVINVHFGGASSAIRGSSKAFDAFENGCWNPSNA